MSSRSILNSVQKDLYGNSANCCNLCSYNGEILETTKIEMAHIIDFKYVEGNARSIKGREGDNSYDNLIVLCPNHHKIIDDKVTSWNYSIEFLKEIKKHHEDKVKKFKMSLGPSHNYTDALLIKEIFNKYDIVRMSNATQDYPESIEANIFEFLDLMDILETKGKLHYPFKEDDLNFYFENIKDNLETLVKYRLLLYKMNLSLDKYHLRDEISNIDLKCLLPIEGYVFGNENLDFVCTVSHLLNLDQENYSTNAFFNKLRDLPQLIKTITGDFNGLIRYYRVFYQD